MVTAFGEAMHVQVFRFIELGVPLPALRFIGFVGRPKCDIAILAGANKAVVVIDFEIQVTAIVHARNHIAPVAVLTGFLGI